jgi:hypothetical protein
MEQHSGVGGDALMAGAGARKVLSRMLHHRGEELHHDPLLQFAIDADVEEAPGVPRDHFPRRRLSSSRGTLAATLHRRAKRVRREQALGTNFSRRASVAEALAKRRGCPGTVKRCRSSNEEEDGAGGAPRGRRPPSREWVFVGFFLVSWWTLLMSDWWGLVCLLFNLHHSMRESNDMRGNS